MALRKITVRVPPKLLSDAQQASGKGITQAVRAGLGFLAASQAYDRLRRLRGKVCFSKSATTLKVDR
jgi:hypothetical protein